MIKFISFEIKIGSTTKSPTKASRVVFHNKIIQLLFPDQKIKQIGIPVTLPLTYQEHGNKPQVIQDIISREFLELNHINDDEVICLIDLTSNDQYLLREQLLEELYKCFINFCKTKVCNKFIVLARDNLGDKSSSEFRRDVYFKNELKGFEYTLFLIFDHGDIRQMSSKTLSSINIKDQYHAAIKELEGDVIQRLETRCIRRLGHFKTRYRHGKSRCRHFSYLMHSDSERDFMIAFGNWWEVNDRKEKVILYDLNNNNSFRSALTAFCESISGEKKIKCYRIESILEKNQSKVRREISAAESCLLVLDVVETGDTLKEYVDLLEAYNINISKDIVVAINKTGNKKTKFDKYVIYGFIEQQSEPTPHECIQCKLKLPFEYDDRETIQQIRSFDMLYMSDFSGYCPEDDPPAHGVAYSILPDFNELLDKFGDWIAYKLLALLNSSILPEQYFILFPDQTQSKAIVDKMRRLSSSINQFDLVPVPNEILKSPSNSNDIKNQIIKSPHNNILNMQLESNTGKNNALILDIFMGSGITAAKLENLLSKYNIKPFAYICLVDFLPNKLPFTSQNIKKLCLYYWYNPREVTSN